MSDFENAVALLETGLDLDPTEFDCGPRFETILNQSIYLGVWCYSDVNQNWFTLEVRDVDTETPAWFEDGPVLKSGSEIRVFYTFEDAFANLGKIVLQLADRSAV